MVDFMNTDGSFGDMTSAPESVRTLVENKGFKNIEDVVQMTTNLESMKGEWANPDSMKLPDAFSDEQMTTIHGKMGVPTDAKGYTFEAPKGMDVDTGLLDSFKAFAVENKMSQDQFGGAVEFYNKLAEGATAQMEELKSQSFDKGVAGLKEMWSDDYETNASAADQIAIDLGLSEHIGDLGLANDPKMVEMLFKIHSATEEGTLKKNGQIVHETKDEQIKKITDNPAFTNNMDPDHKRLVAEWQKLMGIA